MPNNPAQGCFLGSCCAIDHDGGESYLSYSIFLWTIDENKRTGRLFKLVVNIFLNCYWIDAILENLAARTIVLPT